MDRRKLLRVAPLALLVGCAPKKAEPPPDPKSNEVVQFHEALRDGDADIVRRLISAKPYLVNARNEQGASPLQVAQQMNNQELVDLIKRKGGKE
jgi:ankyrin repeat protein